MLVTPQALAISCPVATQRPIGLVRRELAELREMVRLGAGIPGEEQRIKMIKGLIAR